MKILKSKWLWLTIAAVGLVALAVTALILGSLPASGPSGIPPATTTSATATTVTTAGTTTVTTATTTTTATTVTTTSVPTTTTTRRRELQITSHRKTAVTTNEPFTVFAGSSDPDQPLLLDGAEVKRDKNGAFSVEKVLTPGKNTFTFTHKGKTVTYTVTYNYVVMRSHSPDGNRRYESGASFSVVVNARVDSTVTATFRGKTITLKPTAVQEDEDGTQSDTFVNFTGSFTLPDDNTSDLDMGKVTFRAEHAGVVSTAASGTIVCKKAVLPVIGEILAVTAETFDGDKSDDDSRPTNNYLPQGTVDYVVGHSYFGDKEYLNLRCGRRVYVSKKNAPTSQVLQVSKEYAGKLPDTNRLTLAETVVDKRATYLTFDTLWKAPFLLDLLPQEYTDPKIQDYTVDAVTCEYVQITFCYAAAPTDAPVFGDDHPLFTHATVVTEDGNCVLRLYLRRVGGFYGWDASYNEKGQLCFYFLHPAQVSEADNAYGADLTGVTVLLDVGHGYEVPGAYGMDPDHPEGERNYYLAVLLKNELERTGATVVLNRGPYDNLASEERALGLKALKPDLCVAIHHDSNNSSRPHGFGAFHSTLFSADAARYIYDATMEAHIYAAEAEGNRNRLKWHYYFVARLSDCPVVLTENGFMSSPIDHAGIVDPDVNVRKAQAIAAGVARYFLSIRLPDADPPTPPTTTPPTETATTTTETVTYPTTTVPDAILPTNDE
ncbi:MAG: N-acetylmuramoyl-L-alanine amidase [Clostridia bacterium]|nr:N-acetylmuramoyl-L-alanine amidase [Clostridia bacterium]